MGKTTLGSNNKGQTAVTSGGVTTYEFNKDMRTYVGDTSQKNFFAGTWDLSQNNLDRYDPFMTGHAYIIWTKLPSFMPSAVRTKFKDMTEKNFKSFSGISDMVMDTESITGGFAGNTYDAASNLKKAEGNFTIKHQEYLGSPIRELYEYWVTGIRDPETGLCTYHGRLGGADCPYYSAKFHTGELLYIVTDPAGALGGEKSIEFACYYTNVMPTKVPQSHLEFTNGEHNSVEIDQDFKGVWHRSKRIDELARKLIDKKYTLNSFMNYGSATNSGVSMTEIDTNYK